MRTARVPVAGRGEATPRAGGCGSRRVGLRGLASREKSVIRRCRVDAIAIKLCPDRKGSIFSPENSYLWNSARGQRVHDWIYHAALIRQPRTRQTLPTARFASLLSLPKLCDAAPAARVKQTKECLGPAAANASCQAGKPAVKKGRRRK